MIASDQITDLAAREVAYYHVDVRNRGRSVSKGLRLAGSGIQSVNIFNEADQWIANEVSKSGAYILPDLNPGEHLKILVWSRTPTYDYESFYDFEKLPKITHENGAVAQHTWIHAPRLYADTFYFLNTFHWIFQIIIIAVVALIISIPVILDLAGLEKLAKNLKSEEKPEVRQS